jgi:hypothetical protein
LAVVGVQTITATVAMGSTSALSVAVNVVRTSPVSLDSSSAVAVTAAITARAAVAFGSTSTVQVSVQGTQNAVVAIASTSVLTVTGLQTIAPAVALASSSALAVATTITRIAAVAFGSTSTLAVTGLGIIAASVAFSSLSAVQVTAVVARFAAILMAGSSQLTSTGFVSPTIVFAGTSTLTGAGAQVTFGLVVFDGYSSLAVIPVVVLIHPPPPVYIPPPAPEPPRIVLGSPPTVMLSDDTAHRPGGSLVLGSTRQILLDPDPRPWTGPQPVTVGSGARQLGRTLTQGVAAPVTATTTLVTWQIKARTPAGYDDDGNPTFTWTPVLTKVGTESDRRTETDPNTGRVYLRGSLLIDNPDQVRLSESGIAVDLSTGKQWRITYVNDLSTATRVGIERVDG